SPRGGGDISHGRVHVPCPDGVAGRFLLLHDGQMILPTSPRRPDRSPVLRIHGVLAGELLRGGPSALAPARIAPFVEEELGHSVYRVPRSPECRRAGGDFEELPFPTRLLVRHRPSKRRPAQ